MKNLTCKNCGGTMVLDASGMVAVCHYCGTRYVLNHEDTDYYRAFHQQMSRFLSADEDEKARKLRADEFWEKAEQQSFECRDGRTVEVKFAHRYTDRDAEIYVARKNMIIHFTQDKSDLAETYRRQSAFLDYPSADTRSLSDFFPKVSGGFELADGSSLLVIAKDEDEYPLRLFGKLHPRHVAWIISRMENLCCVLEYNSLVHPEITPDTLYINPYTHQASLYGSWWKVGKCNSYSYDKTHLLSSAESLCGIRNTAAMLLGYDRAGSVRPDPKTPAALCDFINSPPKSNAYEDFEYWDAMLVKAFGERKFIRFDTDDEEIYEGKGD